MQISKLLFLICCFTLVTNISMAQVEDYSDSKPKNAATTPNLNKEIPKTDEVKEEAKGWDWSKTRMGGTFGLQFGNYTSIELSPNFAYNVIPRLQIGAGFKFLYIRQKGGFYDPQTGNTYAGFSTTMYGPSIFTRVTIWDRLYAHLEYEMINKEPFYSIDRSSRINVHHLLLGGGYALSAGPNGDMYISILIDVINNRESIYRGNFGIGKVPVILKLGFGFGASGNRKNR